MRGGGVVRDHLSDIAATLEALVGVEDLVLGAATPRRCAGGLVGG